MTHGIAMRLPARAACVLYLVMDAGWTEKTGRPRGCESGGSVFTAFSQAQVAQGLVNDDLDARRDEVHVTLALQG